MLIKKVSSFDCPIKSLNIVTQQILTFQTLEPANIGLQFYVTFDLKFIKIVLYFPLMIAL